MGNGLITTLYSFKGGVGRTMSGANVAFTAAMSGMRVLVMDWDLEAPGMAYYFRGLGDPEQSRAIKAAPGVMDLVWGWRKRICEASGDSDVQEFLASYADGIPFEECIRPVLGRERLPPTGCLDILGAGSKQIDEHHSYAEALARFSWADFFDVSFGGLFIERLRNWAKSRYDVILVDSRTGYADVAGVCTVQLPDVVALAFIYNRQNIEGVANVADSIAAQRDGAVRLRAVPMRLSREGTLDEAEARGRAVRHFTRNGAFTEEAIKADLDRLPIRTAQGLPFYETIAAFMPSSSSAELLAIDYKRLAEALCGRPLAMPVVDEVWREAVARRLEPKTASVEYVRELENADPVRAAEEIDRLLDGALESELHDDRLEREYIETIITAGLNLVDLAFDEVPPEEVIAIAEKAVNLARSEYEMDAASWAATYVRTLMAFDDQFAPPEDPPEHAERLLSYDEILANGEWVADILLQRARIRRELVSLRREEDFEGNIARIAEALSLLNGVDDPHYASDVVIERATLLLWRARLQLAKGLSDESFETAREALELLGRLSRLETMRAGRLLPELHLLLAKGAPDKEIAADHVLAATDQPGLLTPVLTELGAMTGLLLRAEEPAQRALQFIRRLTIGAPTRGAHAPAYFFSRSPAMASVLVKSSTRLMEALSSLGGEESNAAREALVRTSTTCLDLLRRRPLLASSATRQRDIFKLLAETSGLIQIASEANPPPANLRDLIRALSSLDAYNVEPGDTSDPA